MKKGIIGKKLGMTQIFDEKGNVIPVTLIEAGPCAVAQKKTVENDGYQAVQLGYGDIAARCADLLNVFGDRLGCIFDPANFIQCGVKPIDAFKKLEKWITYMHIKDALPNGKVVPPGLGAGNVPAIVAKYAAQGGTVLSLEPHLTSFVGLKALEQEGDESIVGDMKFESSEAAFDFAVNNLYKIVEGM